MKLKSRTNWNTLTDKLIAQLKSSLRAQKKFAADLNTEAVEQLRARNLLAKTKAPRKGRMSVCSDFI